MMQFKRMELVKATSDLLRAFGAIGGLYIGFVCLETLWSGTYKGGRIYQWLTTTKSREQRLLEKEKEQVELDAYADSR